MQCEGVSVRVSRGCVYKCMRIVCMYLCVRKCVLYGCVCETFYTVFIVWMHILQTIKVRSRVVNQIS